MQQVKKHINIRILLLVLFVGYYTDIHFFTHSHIINGVTIVHSHFTWPSSSKDFPAKHSHTGQAVELIAHVTDGTTLVTPFLALPELLPLTRVYTILPDYKPIAQAIPACFYLRGPPVQD